MNKHDILYAAGLFDGEGTVSLMRKMKKERRSPVVSLSSTTRELVDFMKSTFGGTIINVTARRVHHRQAWHWQATHNRALEVLSQLYPYIREPEKKRRANLLLTGYKAVTAANGKYTPEMNDTREAFESEFFSTVRVLEPFA